MVSYQSLPLSVTAEIDVPLQSAWLCGDLFEVPHITYHAPPQRCIRFNLCAPWASHSGPAQVPPCVCANEAAGVPGCVCAHLQYAECLCCVVTCFVVCQAVPGEDGEGAIPDRDQRPSGPAVRDAWWARLSQEVSLWWRERRHYSGTAQCLLSSRRRKNNFVALSLCSMWPTMKD